MPPDPSPCYLIIGAGVFGVSTALALARKHPNSTITLLDIAIPHHASASWDQSKVVRADYPDIFYMQRTLEAMQIWKTDPLYKQFYHESGLIWVDDRGFARTVRENYARLGLGDERERIASPGEVRTLYGGMFAGAEIGDAAEVWVSERSGWVEASRCLSAVIEAAARGGVRCVEAEVAALEFGARRACTGVRLRDGRSISADRVILATGARTAKLLVDSELSQAELSDGGRLVAAAICTGVVKLDAEEAEKFKSGPVFLHAAGNSQGGFAPSWRIEAAQNISQVPASRQMQRTKSSSREMSALLTLSNMHRGYASPCRQMNPFILNGMCHSV
jgi:sarcosine oxidase / L-pipecolate oxidase